MLPVDDAHAGTQGTPLGLERHGAHAAVDHAVPDIVHAREGGDRVARVRRVAVACPEELGEGGGARPHDALEVCLVRLLGPQRRLAAEDELALVLGDIVERVEPGVNSLQSTLILTNRSEPSF